jgi:glycosyltransferase involved in cell wall biosynthesis
MNINWLSPLDQEATEIARYSAQLLPFLEKYIGVTAVHDGDADNVAQWWANSGQAAEPEAGLAPLPVYHIGNNALHLGICRLALREPGLVVLHDLSLIDLAKHISHESDNSELWKAQMREQYGDDVAGLISKSDSSINSHNEMVANYPLFQPFVQNALGVIVHSRYARDILVDKLPAGTPVKHLNLPAPAPSIVADRDYDAATLSFVFCGHVGPNRRLIEFFEAWGRLESPEKINLEIFGNVRNGKQLTRYAEHFGVADYLHLRGYVDESELEKALHCAHFAINLRWPTMGEGSASQLRYWSAALPTLVTDVGWYAELPDDAVCKIAIDNEVAGIQALLEDVLASPGKYRAVGVRGRDFLRDHHSPDNYARELASFAQALCERRLAYRALDQELVTIIASMCEEGTDTGLFRDIIETVAETFTPVAMDAGEIGK